MKYVMIMMLAVLSGSHAYGAQLDAEITGDSSDLEPSFKFLRVVSVEGLDGGRLSESFSDRTIEFTTDSHDSDLTGLIAQINESIRESDSLATVTDVVLVYKAIVSTQEDYATIEYNIEIIPTIRNHILLAGTSVSIDSKWRGFQIDGPVIVDTKYGSFDVNRPASVLAAVLPQAYEDLLDADILSIPLLDASGILEMHLEKWDYLFDPTPIQKSADAYGYDGGGVVISQYSMGLCSITIDPCSDKEWTDSIVLDKEYTIRAVESRDDAVIAIDGYTRIDPRTELVVITQDTTPVVGFQSNIMYGMSAVGAGGAVVFFLFSSRKSRNDKGAGQTGIDPSQLYVRETSISAGGYRTNRGESYLADLRQESKMPV